MLDDAVCCWMVSVVSSDVLVFVSKVRSIIQGWRRGRARGGNSPPSEHVSPLSEGEKLFFGDFWL